MACEVFILLYAGMMKLRVRWDDVTVASPATTTASMPMEKLAETSTATTAAATTTTTFRIPTTINPPPTTAMTPKHPASTNSTKKAVERN